MNARAPNGSAPTVRLLCAADLHLGRQPSRLPLELREALGDELRPAAAWQRLIELALVEEVEALVLAGDVVEHDDDFYEAYSDLENGVRRLVAAGVRVVAVAGNHDLRVLPRLAEAVEGFELLGRGGRWTSTDIASDGFTTTLLGWSFSSGAEYSDPLESLPRLDTGRVVGVLHCDRDGSGSRYAPVRASDLAAAPVDAWLLGHIHKPDVPGEKPIGYLGSLFAADAGEPGGHGAWLLEVSQASLEARLIPLSPLRWEELAVTADSLRSPDEIHTRITAALQELHEHIDLGRFPPRAVGVRLAIEGRSEYSDELRNDLEVADPTAEPITLGQTAYFVSRLSFRVRPALDLAEMARTGDPAGLLAARLLLLRGPACRERDELLEAARERFEPVLRKSYFLPLEAEPPDDAELIELLESAALHSLDILLSQREAR